ncbi:hypothetical protein ACIPWE_38575 [Streptomyces sp. NPDC090073]|uniref:hypothetical protein n=1 Tax=Streptomyces sp. NPDC090073 TaxID=3365936 RepID=UPI0037FE16E8
MSTAFQPTPGEIYVAAARADHLAHCTSCREIAAESEARAAENAASIARCDRLTLGLRRARTGAVTS